MTFGGDIALKVSVLAIVLDEVALRRPARTNRSCVVSLRIAFRYK